MQLAGASGTALQVHSELTLDNLAPLARAEITGVDWASLDPDEGKRLRALGIDAGAQVSIVHRGIFVGKDPIALTVGRMTVALRRAHARAMTVRLI